MHQVRFGDEPADAVGAWCAEHGQTDAFRTAVIQAVCASIDEVSKVSGCGAMT